MKRRQRETAGLRPLFGRLYLDLWLRLRQLGFTFKRRKPTADPTADRQPRRPRVLVVSPFSIHPVIHGGAVRISNLIRQMARYCDVSLLVLGAGTDDPEHREAYLPLCERVVFHRLPDRVEADFDPWCLLPPSPYRFSQPAVTDRISALVDAHGIDIVHLEFVELGAHVRRVDSARTILTEIDIGFSTQQRQRALDIGRRFDATETVGTDITDGMRQERFELLACEAADQVHVMSDNDLQLLASRLSKTDHLAVIPNGVDTEIYQPDPAVERQGVLFLGSFPHLPNLDAFEYLVSDIWPVIRRRQPDARLTVAGARPPDSVIAWNGRNGIDVVGEIDEVASLYRQHRVLVVPLRAGSGTRLKILEAMASGLAVVSTTIGAEGLALSSDPEVILADEAEEIAEEVLSLLSATDDRINSIGRRGRTLVEGRFDWEIIARDLHRAHNKLMRTISPEISPEDQRATSGPEFSPRKEEPAVSVIIPTSANDMPSQSLLDGLAHQELESEFEIIFVDFDSPKEHIVRWRESGIRVVSRTATAFNQGVALNAGAVAAQGPVLVFTSAHAIPADSRWLARLTVPFDFEESPAAVQGGITAQFIDGGPAYNPSFTRESVRWSETHDGVDFSAINAAMTRTVWEQFPFPPHSLLADRAWQRIAADHEFLVLSCLAAAVRLVRQETVVRLVRSSIAEGRAWRALGIRYSASECLADVRHPRPMIDEDGEPAAASSRRHLLFGLLRPIGLFLGNRLKAS